MRVIQLAPTVFGRQGIFGGGERFPLELARALARHTESELVAFGRQAADYRDESGLRVRVLRPLAYVGGHPAHPLSAGLIARIANADIVHAHHVFSAPARLAALARSPLRRPTIVTDHGLPGSRWGGIFPRIYRMLLAVSAYSARVLGAPPPATTVVHGGVDPTRFKPADDGARAGILFVGRLTPHKGIDRLIAALPRGVTLTIAGSAGHDPGPPECDYPSLLRRLADGKDVRFLGAVSEAELPALYRSAVAVALPSVERTCYGKPVPVTELFGLVLLEAMASGTPVVASRTGGIPEVVQESVTGFLVEPGNTDDLADRLGELVRDRHRSAEMGRNGRETVLSRFTWEACAQRCLSAYQSLRTLE